jgi:hypothetical protein
MGSWLQISIWAVSPDIYGSHQSLKKRETQDISNNTLGLGSRENQRKEVPYDSKSVISIASSDERCGTKVSTQDKGVNTSVDILSSNQP